MNSLNKTVTNIRELIFLDRRVSTADVQVHASGEEILITGTVDSYLKAQAIEKIITLLGHTHPIRNDVVIDWRFFRGDDELSQICHSLLRSIRLSQREKLILEVEGGVIRLSGEVLDPFKKSEASGLCWKISGVKDCSNKVRIIDPVVQTKMGLVQ